MNEILSETFTENHQSYRLSLLKMQMAIVQELATLQQNTDPATLELGSMIAPAAFHLIQDHARLQSCIDTIALWANSPSTDPSPPPWT